MLLIFFSGCTNSSIKQKTNSEEITQPIVSEIEKANYRHLLLFNFNENATPEGIKKAEDELILLQGKIPQIKGVEWGLNYNSGNKAKGYTHCFILNFDSEEDLAVYIAHPDHKAYGKILHPQLEDFLVLDYWVKN